METLNNKSVWTDPNHKNHGKNAVIASIDSVNKTYSIRIDTLIEKFNSENVAKYCKDRFLKDVYNGNTNPEHGLVQTIHNIAVGVNSGGFGPNNEDACIIVDVLNESDIKKARKQTKTARREMGKILKAQGFTPMAVTPYKVEV